MLGEDLDRDGRLDLLLLVPSGTSQLLWGTESGVFTAAGPEAGQELQAALAEGVQAAQAVDYDGDGHADLSLSTRGGEKLFRGEGRAFSPVTLTLGSSSANPGAGDSSPGGSHQSFGLGCASTIADSADPGTCISASSDPTLGMLYPLSSDLFVESGTGNVGVGNVDPGAPRSTSPGRSAHGRAGSSSPTEPFSRRRRSWVLRGPPVR